MKATTVAIFVIVVVEGIVADILVDRDANVKEIVADPAFESGCRLNCPADYAPACATNGDCFRWFANDCRLREYNCFYGGYGKHRFVQCEISMCNKVCSLY